SELVRPCVPRDNNKSPNQENRKTDGNLISWFPVFLIKVPRHARSAWTAPAKKASHYEQLPSTSRHRHRWFGCWCFGHHIGVCDLVATWRCTPGRIAGNRFRITRHQFVHWRNCNGRPGSGVAFFRYVRGGVDLLPSEPQVTVLDETAVHFRSFVRSRRLRCH